MQTALTHQQTPLVDPQQPIDRVEPRPASSAVPALMILPPCLDIPACSPQSFVSISSAASSGPAGFSSGTASGSGSGTGTGTAAFLGRISGIALMTAPSATTPSRLSRCGLQDPPSQPQRDNLISKASEQPAKRHSMPLLCSASPAVLMVSPFSLSSPQAPDALGDSSPPTMDEPQTAQNGLPPPSSHSTARLSPTTAAAGTDVQIRRQRRPAKDIRQLVGCSVGPRLASSRVMQMLLQQKGVSFTHPDRSTSNKGEPNVQQGHSCSWDGDNLIVASPSSWNAGDGNGDCEPSGWGSSSGAGSPVMAPKGGSLQPPSLLDVLPDRPETDTCVNQQQQQQQPEASASAPLALLRPPTASAGAFAANAERQQSQWEDCYALPQRRPSSFFTQRNSLRASHCPSRVQPLPSSAITGPRLASARSMRLIQGEAAPQASCRDSPDLHTRLSEGSGKPRPSRMPRPMGASESGAVLASDCRSSASSGNNYIIDSAPAVTAGCSRPTPRRTITESQLIIPRLQPFAPRHQQGSIAAALYSGQSTLTTAGQDDERQRPPLLLPGGMLCTTLEEELGMLSGDNNIQA